MERISVLLVIILSLHRTYCLVETLSSELQHGDGLPYITDSGITLLPENISLIPAVPPVMTVDEMVGILCQPSQPVTTSITTLELATNAAQEYAGPYNKIWSNGQCGRMADFNAKTLTECQLLCETTPSCTAINHNDVTKECVLGACSLPKPDPDLKLSRGWKGYKQIREFAGPYKKIWSNGQCGRMGHFNAKSLTECKFLCETIPSCTAINHNDVTKECVLRACPMPIPDPYWASSHGWKGYKQIRAEPSCQFPFIYKGDTYSACTANDEDNGKFWCSTKTDDQNNHLGEWKHCTAEPSCQFPFIYKGYNYSACTENDDENENLWCSTKTDNQNNHIKGEWKYCTGVQGCKCGQKTVTVTRIVGGEEAQVNEWPWQAALMGPNGPFCGGSLIADRYILTAAHCTQGLRVDDFNVRLGEHDTSSSSESQTVTRSISKIIIHENYTAGSEINDIALIRLSSPVEFSMEVWPVCLPPSTPTYANKVATVTGWGTTSSGGSMSDVLNEVDVKIKSNKDCQSDYGSSEIKETMLCAASPGKDSCQGDSGGPLVFRDGGHNYDQIGVVSWGYGCANPSYPGVYTRVSKYLSWIKDNTQDAIYCI